MTVTVKKLRKCSKGIAGTIANADHHAKPCLQLIRLIEPTITGLGNDYDFVWEQGHNIHLLHRDDGAKIAFRPYSNGNGNWGIDVLSKFSRSQEMRLFTVMNTVDCATLAIFLNEFFSTSRNMYGVREVVNEETRVA